MISGQQLPKVNNKKSSIVDPLVKVQVYGVPADIAEKKTNEIENNGIFLLLHSFSAFHFCFNPIKFRLIQLLDKYNDRVKA